jgi:sucrose-6-phosphate hydrolase SacC (GH32 family)
VLTAASSEYMVGAFDGRKFVPETPKLPGHRGAGFYAAQTFSKLGPRDDRQIQIGWLQAPSPGMPFNQCMSVPLELSLRATSDGPRLAWQPAKELAALGAKSHRLEPGPLKPGVNPLADLNVDLVEVRLDFAPGDAQQVALNIRGNSVVYESGSAEIVVNGHRAPAPLQGGRQRLIVLLDRTTLEVFASDGLTFVPLPTITRPENKSLELTAKGGTAEIFELEVHELKSAWPASP